MKNTPSTSASTFAEEEKQLEVSFTILSVTQLNQIEVVRKIASSINLELGLNINQNLPFVAPNRYANVRKQDKIFIFGSSGSGKSRLIFELIKEKLNTLEKIYLLNSRQAIGEESGRTGLRELVRNFSDKDAVIWDNSPDDLIKKDESTFRKALEIVSSKDVTILLIALKPKYLEAYRSIASEIIEFYPFEIAYDKSHLKELLYAYGSRIAEFRESFAKNVEPEFDKIADILWNKEPIPLTVLNYLKEILEKKLWHSTDAIKEAEAMLGRSEFYEHQFKLIQGQRQRMAETDFLYTLRLCYDLRLNRSIEVVEGLQKAIFGTDSPIDALHRLSPWVYLSERYYSMHDAPREAITIPEYLKPRIVSFLIKDFLEVVPNAKNGTYSFGLFLGKHIDLLAESDSNTLGLPNEIYQFMKQDRYFERGIGEGAGESFVTFGHALQEKLLRQTDVDAEFARGLGASLANNFPSLTKPIRETILGHLKRSLPFARGFGEGLGKEFSSLPQIIQNEIFEMIPINENSQFVRGLSTGLGYSFSRLDIQAQNTMFGYADKLLQFAAGLGFGLGNSFTSFTEDTQKDIFDRAKRNSELTRGLGLGIGRSFQFLSEDFMNKFLILADQNPRFAWGLGYELGYNIVYLNASTRMQIFNKIESNPEFAFGIGLGLGIAFDNLPLDLQENTIKKTELNPQFSNGLGYGLGFAYKFLSDKVRGIIDEKVSSNGEFAQGFGYGLGYTLSFLPSTLQEDVFNKIEENVQFSRGVGYGIGHVFTQQFSKHLQDLVLTKTELNSELTRGISAGLGAMFLTLSEEFRKYAFARAKEDAYFALGFGSGIGEIITYLSPHQIYEMIKMTERNRKFAEGLGYQVARDLMYIDNELKFKIFDLSKTNSAFAFGLGMGIGATYYYLDEETRHKIVKETKHNLELARGFGAGIGMTIAFLPEKLKDTLLDLIHKDVQIERGFGLGQGLVLPYASDLVYQKILEQIKLSDYFAEGVGEGLGTCFRYLEKSLQEICFQLTENNGNFARGLGKGTAQVFTYSKSSYKENILHRMSANDHFAFGIGFGLGQDIPYSKVNYEMERFVTAEYQNSQFSKGFGSGLGISFSTMNIELRKGCLNRSSNDKPFWAGLGQGLASCILYADDKLQKEILRTAGANNELANSIGFGLGYNIQYVNPKLQALISEQLKVNSHFAFGLGEGAGYNFQSLDSTVHEKALLWAGDIRNFAMGLASGLRYSFKNLDDTIQQGLLLYFKNNPNSEASFTFGQGLAYTFPSLPVKLQQELLKEMHNGSEFYNGLIYSLDRILPYLDETLKKQVTIMIQDVRKIQELASAKATAAIVPTSDEDHCNEFPLTHLLGKKASESLSPIILAEDEITFSGIRKNYCICFIDMMDSTKIASKLNDAELTRYYAIFLNAMATIVPNFSGKIIKNAGDALIYYFPDTADSSNISAFKDVLECGITMIAAHRAINSNMQSERLPPVNYRISADYGMVAVAKSKSSQSDDLFGSAMNVCAKINSKAPANGMVIGEDLYQLVTSIEDFRFERVKEGSDNKYSQYPAYIVQTKEKRNILNPFKRVSESKKEE